MRLKSLFPQGYVGPNQETVSPKSRRTMHA
jgi:hypothetical protein